MWFCRQQLAGFCEQQLAPEKSDPCPVCIQVPHFVPDDEVADWAVNQMKGN